jgi:cell pole-organizing protein PopZ
MNQPAKVQEPSMEEILASIRRIIADDDAAKAPANGPEPAASAAAVAPLRPVAPPAAPAPAARAPSEPAVSEATLDDALAEIQAAAAPAQGAADLASDVLELTEEMAGAAMPAARGFQTIDGHSDVVFEDSERERIPEPDPRPFPGHDRVERRLMSPATSAAVDSAFNSLAHTVLVQNARTLEDLVREMLQPLLKTWLDDNLPGLVERLVRAEIERVSRGRG